MSRYAAIDTYSGYLWGTAGAETPALAAAKIDHDTSGAEREVEMIEHRPSYQLSGRDGYRLYVIPDGVSLDGEDGQDAAVIERIEAWGCVAVVECRKRDDD